MSETWTLWWALAAIMLFGLGAGALVGAGLTATLALLLAPRSSDEAWATLREGGGRFSAWLKRTFAPGEEDK